MAFSDKLTVVIDFVTGPAQSGVKKLRTEVAQAEGAMGKMKAATVGVGSALNQYAGQAAMAAGAALVAFGVKSVKAFQDTALAAGEFADAAGIAVEDASRWTEVAGDLGIEAGAVQGAILKMNKALGDGKSVFADYGVEVVKTKDGMVDSNATFTNALTTIGAIEDPTLRAKAAQEVFGKSYASVAQLMELSATDLKAALDGVSSAKIITDREKRNAREFQAAMDTLKDRLEDVQLEVGGALVPVLVDLATTVDTVATNFGKLDDAVEGLTGKGIVDWGQSGTEVVDGLGRALDENSNIGERAIGVFDGLISVVPVFGQKIADATPDVVYLSEEERLAAEMSKELAAAAEGAGISLEDAGGRAEYYASRVAGAKLDTDRAERAISDMNDALRILQGNLDDRSAWRSLKESLDELQEKIADGESTWMELGEATDDVVQDTARYIETLDGITPEVKTQLYTMLDEGALNEVLLYIDEWKKGVNVPVRFKGQGTVGFEKRATGGPVRAGEPYLVGEQGPELVVPSQSGTVLNAGRTRAALSPVSGSGMAPTTSTTSTTGTGGITVNIYPKTLPTDRELIDLINNVRRRNGNVI
jgi:hypothetical protein